MSTGQQGQQQITPHSQSNGDYEPTRHPRPRGMMRPSFFPYPRRGMHMRPGFFNSRPFMHQRGGMRLPRPWVRPPPPMPPHFAPMVPPFPPQPIVWTTPPPPPPNPEAQTDPDTLLHSLESDVKSLLELQHVMKQIYYYNKRQERIVKKEEESKYETSDHNRKKKKRAPATRPWDKEAAERAHALELECQKKANAKSIVIKFPDPELSKEIVQGFHQSIDNVHFQGPCGGRYCFVTLKDEADIEKVMEDINKIKFGVGFLSADRKVQKPEENTCYENIDPFTLYVGNLALGINVSEVKEKFPSATRVDVGHAKKLKNTRYAFVKFATAEAALEAYKESVNTIMASRSIIVRFRRHAAPVGPPGEKPAEDENNAGKKLTVGAKLKAKKEKAAREMAEADIPKIVIKDEVESEEEVEMENDDESASEFDMEDYLDVEAEDDDEDMGGLGSGGSESEEEYGMSGDEYATDDDDQPDSPPKNDDDDYFDDDEDCKDVFSLTFN